MYKYLIFKGTFDNPRCIFQRIVVLSDKNINDRRDNFIGYNLTENAFTHTLVYPKINKIQLSSIQVSEKSFAHLLYFKQLYIPQTATNYKIVMNTIVVNREATRKLQERFRNANNNVFFDSYPVIIIRSKNRYAICELFNNTIRTEVKLITEFG